MLFKNFNFEFCVSIFVTLYSFEVCFLKGVIPAGREADESGIAKQQLQHYDSGQAGMTRLEVWYLEKT
jgi:hypothetical protein